MVTLRVSHTSSGKRYRRWHQPPSRVAFFVVRLSLKRAGTLRHVRTCEILEKSAEGIDVEDRAYGLALWWPWPWPVVASTTATMPPIAAAPST